jgi:GT2 family glycosyltransferase
MKIHVIAVAYRRPEPLEILVKSFRVQTNKNWTLRIIHDGPPLDGMEEFCESLKDPRIEFDYTKNVNGFFGHVNRSMMLQNTEAESGDYVLITNDDNYYVPLFIEIMLEMCNPKVGFVFCNTVHNYMRYDVLQTQIRVGRIDMGSFIVRVDVAKAVGFNHTVEVADGIYAEECAAECRKRGLMIVGIPKPLFIHN